MSLGTFFNREKNNLNNFKKILKNFSRKLEEAPDQYSVAVDDILDNLDFDEDEEEEEEENKRVDMIKREIAELERENDKAKLAKADLLGQLHSSGVPTATNGTTVVNLRKKQHETSNQVADIAPENFIGKLDADFRFLFNPI